MYLSYTSDHLAGHDKVVSVVCSRTVKTTALTYGQPLSDQQASAFATARELDLVAACQCGSQEHRVLEGDLRCGDLRFEQLECAAEFLAAGDGGQRGCQLGARLSGDHAKQTQQAGELSALPLDTM